MINEKHFRKFVIRKPISYFNLWSESAEELLWGTSCTETFGGYYLKQGLNYCDDGRGVALGPFNMEPFTHDDLSQSYIIKKPELHEEILHYFDFKSEDKSYLNYYNKSRR